MPVPRKSIFAFAILTACARSSPPPVDTAAAVDTAFAKTDSVVIDTSAPAVDTTAVPPRIPASETSPHHRSLSPLADSISQRLVFVPRTQDVFTAAARGKRMLVDLGRVDLELSKPSRLAAFREAAAARSPLPVGARLRLHGRWGADDVEVTGFDVWNGRIVATIKGASRVDSLARKIEPLIGVAQKSDSAKPPLDTTCTRDTVDSLLDKRLDVLRDSVLTLLRQGDKPRYPRLAASIKEHSTRVMGCFPTGRAVLVTGLVAGDYEWVREVVLMVSEDGKAKPLNVRDFRFRGHDLLQALDADDDGVDEIAARAYTERAGGTVVLRVVEGKRLERVTSGFAWER